VPQVSEMGGEPSEPKKDQTEGQQAARIQREIMGEIDPIVRRLLAELAVAAWGANGPFRRRWRLDHAPGTWAVRAVRCPEQFGVSVDLALNTFRVDCQAGPVFSHAITETHLRQALAIAHHRGPGAVTSGQWSVVSGQ